jgi:hypothetical protein
MNPALSYIYARLSEPSTWRGIIALVTAAGVALSPDQVDKIVAAGLALIGLIGAFTPDKMKAALLMLIILPLISGTASAQSPILPWRAQMHQRLQKLENQPHATPSPAPIQAPAPQPIHIYLPSQPANPPLQTFPIQGQPQQSFPIQGQPKQDFPIQGQPKQDFPLPGVPKQDLPAPGTPKQDFPIQGPAPKQQLPPAPAQPNAPANPGNTGPVFAATRLG